MSATSYSVHDGHVTVQRDKFLIIKPTRCTNFSNLFLERNSTCFGQFLCPSSGVFRSTYSNGVCHKNLLTSCEQDQDGIAVPYWSRLQAVSKPAWHIPLLHVQRKTPDDGQRNCPEHVEFHSKNKFEKLVHLVGCIIRNLFSTIAAIHHMCRPSSPSPVWAGIMTLWQEPVKVGYPTYSNVSPVGRMRQFFTKSWVSAIMYILLPTSTMVFILLSVRVKYKSPVSSWTPILLRYLQAEPLDRILKLINPLALEMDI